MPNPAAAVATPGPTPAPEPYQAPTFEVICLACEISAYAPDDDTPLF
jgi:hypothetical protein